MHCVYGDVCVCVYGDVCVCVYGDMCMCVYGDVCGVVILSRNLPFLILKVRYPAIKIKFMVSFITGWL